MTATSLRVEWPACSLLARRWFKMAFFAMHSIHLLLMTRRMSMLQPADQSGCGSVLLGALWISTACALTLVYMAAVQAKVYVQYAPLLEFLFQVVVCQAVHLLQAVVAPRPSDAYVGVVFPALLQAALGHGVDACWAGAALVLPVYVFADWRTHALQQVHHLGSGAATAASSLPSLLRYAPRLLRIAALQLASLALVHISRRGLRKDNGVSDDVPPAQEEQQQEQQLQSRVDAFVDACKKGAAGGLADSANEDGGHIKSTWHKDGAADSSISSLIVGTATKLKSHASDRRFGRRWRRLVSYTSGVYAGCLKSDAGSVQLVQARLRSLLSGGLDGTACVPLCCLVVVLAAAHATYSLTVYGPLATVSEARLPPVHVIVLLFATWVMSCADMDLDKSGGGVPIGLALWLQVVSLKPTMEAAPEEGEARVNLRASSVMKVRAEAAAALRQLEEEHQHLSTLQDENDRLLREQDRLHIALDAYKPTAVIDAGTPADCILGMVGDLLEGRMPDLRTILRVQKAVLSSRDIFQPVDLGEQMRSFALADDVSAAIFAELAICSSPKSASAAATVFAGGQHGPEASGRSYSRAFSRGCSPLQHHSCADDGLATPASQDGAAPVPHAPCSDLGHSDGEFCDPLEGGSGESFDEFRSLSGALHSILCGHDFFLTGTPRVSDAMGSSVAPTPRTAFATAAGTPAAAASGNHVSGFQRAWNGHVWPQSSGSLAGLACASDASLPEGRCGSLGDASALLPAGRVVSPSLRLLAGWEAVAAASSPTISKHIIDSGSDGPDALSSAANNSGATCGDHLVSEVPSTRRGCSETFVAHRGSCDSQAAAARSNSDCHVLVGRAGTCGAGRGVASVGGGRPPPGGGGAAPPCQLTARRRLPVITLPDTPEARHGLPIVSQRDNKPQMPRRCLPIVSPSDESETLPQSPVSSLGSPTPAAAAAAAAAARGVAMRRSLGSGKSISAGSSFNHKVSRGVPRSSVEQQLQEGCHGGGGGIGARALRHALDLAPLAGPPIMDEVERALSRSEEWQFDTFHLYEVTHGRPLSTLAYYLLHRNGLMEHFHIKGATLARFFRRIETGYRECNPYHNRTHAANVLQAMNVILNRSGIVPSYADPLTHLACLFAAAVHDYEHFGLTNDFLVATSNKLALRYNDRSPQENHHLAATFDLLVLPEYNFMSHLPKAEFERFRRTVIDLVLATDMKQHFSVASQFNAVHRVSVTSAALKSSAALGSGELPKLSSTDSAAATAAASGSGAPPLLVLDESQRMVTLQMALKASDLGHMSAEQAVHLRWVDRLEREMFLQGDKEKAAGLPVSPLFDRTKPGVTKCQVGFYDIVVIPLFMNFSTVFSDCQPLLTNALANHAHWSALETTKDAAA